MINIALAGNPNSGKTTLFNSLTGSTAHVGNWPGVTVDKKEGTYKKCPEPISLIDLPGIYSLSPYTPEEVISRNYVLDEKPDCVINIVDASNLERNLYLTTQIMEIDVPMVIALNMMDVLEKNGDKIDAKSLEAKIGVPVVEISALKEKNLDELMKRSYEACKAGRKATSVLKNSDLSHLINDVKIALEGQDVENALFHSIKLIENDELEVKDHSDVLNMIDEFKKTFKDSVFEKDFEALIADSRYKYISKNYSKYLTKNQKQVTYKPKKNSKLREKLSKNKFFSKLIKNKKADNAVQYLSKSDKADKVLTHRFWGIPIFLVILFLIFHLTFSENLLFIGGALGGDSFVTCPGTAFEGVFGAGGINSPGVILQSLMILLTDTIIGAVQGAMATCPAWAIGLVCDGMLGGLAAVLSFVPQILLLFLFFAILEDSGYMARVAFILDRIFRRYGLSGRAFMPMIMGFGCSIPAMINTRTLADENERTATIRVIPFFSCGAKLPILTAIAGGIVLQFGVGNADLITYGMYLLGMVVAIVSVIIMRKTTMRGEVPPFIMELPAYHVPQFKNLMLHLWDKLKHFIKKAFTIIFASTIVIWFVSHFAFNWHYLEDAQMGQSILAGIGQFFQPLFTPLGFGSQLGEWGWIFIVAAVSGLIAKENVIATFATLAACIVAGFEGGEEGIQAVQQMIIATNITIPALIAFITFNMTTIPCFAAVATAKAELPKNKFKSTVWFWVLTSYIVSSMVYLIGSWWWTVFIFIALAIVAVFVIKYINKRQDKKMEMKAHEIN